MIRISLHLEIWCVCRYSYHFSRPMSLQTALRAHGTLVMNYGTDLLLIRGRI